MSRQYRAAFSLIELLIVVAIMAALMGPTVLRLDVFSGRAREETAEHNRRILRRAIDDFRADKGRYPAALADLVAARYLREIPVNPYTRSDDSWIPQPSAPGAADVWDVTYRKEEDR